MLDKKDLLRTIDFIYSREQPSGGFSFAHTMTPTLEDTYYAIRSLDILSQLIDSKISINKRTIDYVGDVLKFDLNNYQWLFRFDWLCKKLDLESPKPKAKKITNDIGTVYYYLQFCSQAKVSPKFEDIVISYLQSRSLENLKYAQEISMFILVVKSLKLKIDLDQFKDYLLEVQNGDGGFGFLPGSTSYLENTYYAIKALDGMGLKPLMSRECADFILGCRANNGGYGRQSKTVPTLEATYYVLRSLSIINKWKVNK